MLKVVPMNLKEANEFVANFHRHNKPVQGAKFAIGASDGEHLVGVAIVGRPVSRHVDDGYTMEVTRVCSNLDAPKNTGSFLYGRCWRVWQQMGGERMITYTLESESGATMRAVGWKFIGAAVPRKQGSGWQNRPGREWQPIYGQQKLKWMTER